MKITCKALAIIALLVSTLPMFGQVTITNVFVSASTSTTATIQWTTSGPSTSQVLYGFDSSIPFGTPVNPAMVTSHTVTLTVLDPSRFYYFAVVSIDGGGHVTQSATSNFALCGGSSQPFNPATGTINNYYEYGTFTLTWVPPTGSSATPTVCGQPMPTTVTGALSGGASMSASVADSYKAIPGPGTWHVAATDAGNLSPIAFNYPLSAQNTDVSAQMQTAAAAAGLTDVLANLNAHTVYPPWICTTFNGLCAASGGVTSVLPGTNVTCTPFSGGKCVGDVTINSTASGTSNPAAPQGSQQYANLGATAFAAAPPLNTDIFNISNDGATQTITLGCSSTACDIFTPANSPDGEAGEATTAAGKLTTKWVDARGNRVGEYYANPQPSPSFPSFSVIQAAHAVNVLYTDPNPTGNAGTEQVDRVKFNMYSSPGFDNGNSGCPLFCPPGTTATATISPGTTAQVASCSLWSDTVPRPVIIPGAGPAAATYNGTATCSGTTMTLAAPTSTAVGVGTAVTRYGGVANWTIVNDVDDTVIINTQGISNSRATSCVFAGIGDHQCGAGGVFINSAGSGMEPSAEGLYGFGSIHIATMGDWLGTITTLIDANHLKASQSTNAGWQGQGRFLIDFTNFPRDNGGTPISNTTPVALVTAPVGATPGYITINNITLPASIAVGTTTNDCTVSTQVGGVAIGQNSSVNGCVITVTSGTFVNTSAAVCMASQSGMLFNIGMQMVQAPTALSGGHQTIFATMRRSIPAGSIVYQGGACSWGISLNGDFKSFQTQNNTNIFASVFPIIGSDAHRLYYVNYQGSQVWSVIPNAGSQWGSQDTGNTPSAHGFHFDTLTRVSNLVSGVTFNHGQSTPPGFQILNGAKFFAISGCTEPTMNSPGVNSTIGMPDNVNTSKVTYTLAGPDNVCTNALLTPQNTTVGVVFMAEVYDVENHTPGLAPFDIVDGTFAMSYQPGFQSGDTIDSPPHYQSTNAGIRISDELATPQATNGQSFPVWINAQNVASYVGSAIRIDTFAQPNEYWGSGGVGYPFPAVNVNGYIGSLINAQYAPAPSSSLINVGFAAPGVANPSSTNSSFRQYNIWNVNGSQSSLHFDMDSQGYCWTFNFGACNMFLAPNVVAISSVPAQLSNPQFTINEFPNGFLPQSQIKECSPINANGASPPCYQNIETGNAVITQNGTPGTTMYNYVLGITDVAGISFTPIIQTFTGAATLTGVNSNNIPCSDLPAGKTGTMYVLVNPIMASVGACPNSATVIVDDGAHRGPSLGHNPMNDGIFFDSGGFRAQGSLGMFAFSNPDIFNAPFQVTASFSQPSAGVISANTTTLGDHLAELLVGVVGSGTASNTDMLGELSFSAVTTATYTFTRTYTSHPECFAQPQATTATSGAPFVTYTGVASFTINFGSAFTGNVSYYCVARN